LHFDRIWAGSLTGFVDKRRGSGMVLHLDQELLRAKSLERYLALPGAFRQTARATPGEELS
jgi:hypothetical protein